LELPTVVGLGPDGWEGVAVVLGVLVGVGVFVGVEGGPGEVGVAVAGAVADGDGDGVIGVLVGVGDGAGEVSSSEALPTLTAKLFAELSTASSNRMAVAFGGAIVVTAIIWGEEVRAVTADGTGGSAVASS